ncbi:MAG: hypothetical protein R3E12_11430 [Candidatus Eisenbacteria bacterium]
MRIRREQALFLIVLALGVVLRVALLGNRGYESDLELFRRWAVAARADGFGAFARTIPCNYMPLYLEALRVLAWLGGHLGFDPVTSPATFVSALKVVPNLADLIAAGLLYRGLSPAPVRRGLVSPPSCTFGIRPSFSIPRCGDRPMPSSLRRGRVPVSVASGCSPRGSVWRSRF